MATLMSTHNIFLWRNKKIIPFMRTCPCNDRPYTPISYSKTGVYKSIHNFLIYALKHRLWVLTFEAGINVYLQSIF